MTRTARLNLSKEPEDTARPDIIFDELIQFLEDNLYLTETRSYPFAARSTASGAYFLAGYYDYSTTDANLTQASLTVTHGAANHAYAGHAFIVSGGNGSTDGSDLVLTVSGTSMTDGGVRTAGDSEVVEATAGDSALNSYYETSKKWIGTITFTLSSTGGSTYSYDFNYGLAKYEDFGNRDFVVTDFECVGLANANDSGFNIELCHHKATGHTYAATGFVAGVTATLSMNDDYVTEKNLAAGKHFAYKWTGLSVSVNGDNGEGLIVRVTTGSQNSVSYMATHIGVSYPLV